MQPTSYNSDSETLLAQGIAALNAGDRAAARELLAQSVRLNPADERAWLWLSGAVETDDERRRCLERVLQTNPHNAAARRGLASLTTPAAPLAAHPLADPSDLGCDTQPVQPAGNPTPQPTSVAEPGLTVEPASQFRSDAPSSTAPEPATADPAPRNVDVRPGVLVMADLAKLRSSAQPSRTWRRDPLVLALIGLLGVVGVLAILVAMRYLGGPGQAVSQAVLPTSAAQAPTQLGAPTSVTTRTVAPTAAASPTSAPASTPTAPATSGVATGTPEPAAAATSIAEPGSAADLVQQGMARVEQGDYAGAIALYDQALVLNSENANAFYQRGRAHSNLSEFDQALDDYARALHLKPNFPNVYYSRCVLNRVRQEYQRALADCEQALHLDPGYADAYNGRGAVYAELGDQRAALDDTPKRWRSSRTTTGHTSTGGFCSTRPAISSARSPTTPRRCGSTPRTPMPTMIAGWCAISLATIRVLWKTTARRCA